MTTLTAPASARSPMSRPQPTQHVSPVPAAPTPKVTGAQQPLVLTEGAPPRHVSLTPAEHAAVTTLGIADVAATTHPGMYAVTASSKIGAVTLDTREVVVRPKITELSRLVFLLGYNAGHRGWLEGTVHLTEDTDLLPALAEAFTRHAARATEQGLLQGYRTVSESLPVLRGTLLAGEQMPCHYGMPVPVAVEYDDFTADIAENRLLLTALLRCLTIPRIRPDVRRRLHRLRVTLADVTAIPRGTALPTWTPHRLNTRYHDALRLAELILAAQSFEQRVGDLAVTGFMFDMWQVFEGFVCTALGEALSTYGGTYATQYRTHLDEDQAVDIRPDLAWLGPRGRPRAVIDAKYKAQRPSGFPEADLYQVLAYCTVLGLDQGHLVYARGNGPRRSHRVRRAGITINCHTLDLALRPADLLAQVDALADSISGSAKRA